MSNSIGFKAFTKPAKIDPAFVAEKLKNVDETLFVYYTGGRYIARRNSGRSAILGTITEVKKPVPLSELIRRAATVANGLGFSPDAARSGLFLHGGSKPAVYLAVEKKADGSFVAARDFAFADGFEKPIKRGDVILSATGTKPAAKAVTKAKGKSVAKA